VAPSDIAIPGDAGAVLVVDLDAIAANYRLIRETCPTATVGAAVKADAYGLGLAPVARTLAAEGCATFFVATPGEGVALRAVLPGAEIVVLNGPDAGSLDLFRVHRLSPALNCLEQIDAVAGAEGLPDAWLHVDTGMNRLGLSPAAATALLDEPARLAGTRVTALLSHLACADDSGHAMNGVQLEAFRELRRRTEAAFGPLRASLANSPGVFLGDEFHLDMVRPGAALYGLNPRSTGPNPMKQVVGIYAKILQVRDVDSPMTVGYGAAHRVTGPGRVATAAAGYADGYPRAAATSEGSSMNAYVADRAAPLVGRVSMDLITIDVSDIPAGDAVPGAIVELLGPHVSPDELAAAAGTIGYEIIGRLGTRLARVYRGGAA
jgi:alanine racemase